METINISRAKSQFSRLIKRVELGEEIIIAKAGKPIARLVPIEKKTCSDIKVIGFMADHGCMPHNLDTFKSIASEEIALMVDRPLWV